MPETTRQTGGARRRSTAPASSTSAATSRQRSEDALMDAYARAGGEDAQAVVLNFTGLEYMNSGGIGLLVTLLVRANRAKQQLLAVRPDRALPADLRADPPRRGDRHPRHRGRRASRRPLRRRRR